MNKKNVGVNVLFCLTMLIPIAVQATVPADLVGARYAVYSADINGDECADFLVKAKDAILMLDLDDLIMPIATPARNKPFMIVSGPGCNYTSAEMPTASQLKLTAWDAAAYSATVADVKGNGNGSVFLAPVGATGPVFNVVRNADGNTFTLLQVLQGADLGLNAAGVTVDFTESNSDTRSDLVISQNGALLGAYAAEADGTFLLQGAENNVSSATITWNKFIQHLRIGAVDNALELVAEGLRDTASIALHSPTANPQAFAASVTRFEIVEELSGFVRAVILIPTPSVGDMGYFITFGKGDDGIWRIESF